MKKATVIAILLYFALVNVAFAQQLKTLIVDFDRTYKEGDEGEQQTQGTIYFRKEGIIAINVSHPIDQWLIYEKSKLSIYYPKSNKAFIIESQVPFSLPFFNAFIGVIEDDYGLAKAGYSVVSHEVKGDALIFHWMPPKKQRKLFGEYVLTYREDRIVLAESKV